ncbi:MAG: hypothetical protein ACD_30C00023G0007 [uncultured bacterium]|uniref:Uncharacterized protein n=3 Tax=Candidatus Daviesiibacteriota TaxID=1752718 RepID=A0A0G0EWC2_9BACT|nr:MAG: hypothetical protein ACD_30C00023G0007 [uncultured bacterium]KKQ09837.1 MAG: hypothetical protein US19_C0010G0015 [Candidatus Daviesbacteria bacterium GW2011_GWB1_36_5]KKQ16016.1 MAG: hypothetical protein US28_C0006G0011 [Candidatus Daviesbacteria bacterium GW2011_GWA1_36_8]OGE36351.1 MAG: hypothetical protein A3E66_05650 [Candidatus Daviesbacteria bacterium RIFCSPHIGHO2_12_FULL_37_16]
MKNSEIRMKKQIKKTLNSALLTLQSQQGVVPIILIIAGVIIALAVLVTILRFSLGGSKKPSTTTQSTSKPTAIAQASSSPLAEIVDPGDECEASCEEELEGEGDGVKASDLDGES